MKCEVFGCDNEAMYLHSSKNITSKEENIFQFYLCEKDNMQMFSDLNLDYPRGIDKK